MVSNLVLYKKATVKMKDVEKFVSSGENKPENKEGITYKNYIKNKNKNKNMRNRNKNSLCW